MEFLKKINEFLQKSGMLRYGGAKGVYKNAKDAPDQIIPGYEYKSVKKIDEEFNPTKDSSGKVAPAPEEKDGSDGKGWFWITLVVAIIFGLLFLMVSGFSFWFILFLIIWGFYLRFIWVKMIAVVISTGKIIGFGILMLIISFLFMSFGVPDEGSLSKVDISDLKKYDGQVIKISSLDGEIEGVAVLAIPEDGSLSRLLRVEYYINIVEDLPVNKKCFECESNPKYSMDCRSYDKYNYAGRIYGALDDKDYPLTSQVYPVFCKDFQDPLTLSSSSSGMIAGCFDDQVGKDLVTNKFYHYQQATYIDYDQFIENNKFRIHDAKKHMTRDNCVDGKPGSSTEGMDAVSATEDEASATKVFTLQFSE